MDEKHASPYNFTNLDSSLIRSTKRNPTPSPAPAPQEASPALAITDEVHRYAAKPEEHHKARQTVQQESEVDATTPPPDHDPMLPTHHAPIVAEVHRAVKQVGRFEGTHRYTEEEKDGLDEVIRAFKKKRIRTSENEIARIGINFLLEDHRRNGDQSILAQVLQSVHH